MKSDHRYLIRLGHWLTAVAIPVLALSGIEIFRAFPAFTAKLPDPELLPVPAWPGLGLGGWLGGALSWHMAFAWIFLAAVLLQFADLARGGWRRVWLSKREWRGILPMARHYFLRRPKPPREALYNPLQKFAYLSMFACELLALATGFLLLQSAFATLQPAIAWQATRALHFAALCGFAAFLPGHLLMVVLAGRKPFLSMATGEPQAM